MKKLFYFLTLIFVTYSCEDNNEFNFSFPELFDPTNEEELITEIKREDGIDFKFYYDNLRRLTKKEEYWPPQILITEYQYDSQDRIIKSMDYDREIFLGESEYYWNNDSIEMVVYRIQDGSLVKIGKTTFKYNDANLMIHADVYVPEKDDSWDKVAYYNFEWENQNYIYSEVWGPLGNSLSKENRVSLIREDELLEINNYNKSADTKAEIVKLQEETYNYDSKVNPLRAISAGKVLLPFVLNCSKNNVIHSSYIDINNNTDVRDYRYDYNDLKHPVFYNMKWETNTTSGELNWNYFYKDLSE